MTGPAHPDPPGLYCCVAPGCAHERGQVFNGGGGDLTPERACCGACGRALAACEWCGTADVLTGPEGQRWPVTRRPGRDGAYHDPCYEQEQAMLGRVASAARRFRGEDTP